MTSRASSTKRSRVSRAPEPTSSSRTSRKTTRRVTAAATSSAENAAVVILAGGGATRFPGKLFADVGGVPLLGRVFSNFMPSDARTVREVLVMTTPLLRPDVARVAERWAPALAPSYAYDRAPLAGPRAALTQAAEILRSDWLFLVGGDMPLADLALLESLKAANEKSPQTADAVVARTGGRRQPLGALYRRAALRPTAGEPSMHDLLDTLRLLEVELPESEPWTSPFVNINHPADVRAFEAARRST